MSRRARSKPELTRRARAVLLAAGLGAAVVAVAIAVTLVLSAAPADAPTAVAEGGAPSSASTSPPAAASTEPGASASQTTAATPGPAESTAPTPSESATSAEPSVPDYEASLPVTDADRGGPVKVVSHVTTDDPVFFITIDDGLVPNEEALRMVEERQIPVTAFLTEFTVPDKIDYFERITRFGGTIGNHSMVHHSYTDPDTNVHWEICKTQERFDKYFGFQPFLMRPPYGNGATSDAVQSIAKECGISRIIMWNVVASEDGSTIDFIRPPLRKGDIVLFHFTDGLDEGLRKILDMADEEGLRPAALTDYI